MKAIITIFRLKVVCYLELHAASHTKPFSVLLWQTIYYLLAQLSFAARSSYYMDSFQLKLYALFGVINHYINAFFPDQ